MCYGLSLASEKDALKSYPLTALILSRNKNLEIRSRNIYLEIRSSQMIKLFWGH